MSRAIPPMLVMPRDNRLLQSGTNLTAAELRAAGVPVLRLDADMVNASDWDREAAVERMTQFLCSELRR